VDSLKPQLPTLIPLPPGEKDTESARMANAVVAGTPLPRAEAGRVGRSGSRAESRGCKESRSLWFPCREPRLQGESGRSDESDPRAEASLVPTQLLSSAIEVKRR